MRAGLGPLPPLPAAFFREEEDKETTYVRACIRACVCINASAWPIAL